MMENASVWRRQRTPYIHCNLLISFIYLIDQKKVFGEPYLGVAAQRFPYTRGRAATAVEEEASVEALAEETGLSGIDGGGGDRQSREFWDEKRNDTGRATIYRFENISSSS
jgi:hypothetical protein